MAGCVEGEIMEQAKRKMVLETVDEHYLVIQCQRAHHLTRMICLLAVARNENVSQRGGAESGYI